MNPRHLSAFVWLRRRLLVNQLRRNGLGNQIILLLAFVSLALGAAGLFVGGVALGASALPAAPPVGRLLAWDGLVAGFLFVRAMGLLAELQRTDGIDPSRYLHLPVSPAGAFAVNYVSSLAAPSLLFLAAAAVGLALGQTLAGSPLTLLTLPLLVAFVFAVTATTDLVQGGIAALALTPRRKRAVALVAAFVVVGLVQVPNLLNMTGAFRGGGNKLDRTLVEPVARAVNVAMPPAWLALGAADLADGSPLPALAGTLGLALIGAVALRLSYRTALRLAKGTDAGASRAAPAAPAAETTRPRFAEWRLPGVPEPAAAVALASFRSLSRAPEARAALVGAVFVLAIFGVALFASAGGLATLPREVRPLVAFSAVGFSLVMTSQLVGNQFGGDRAGFRGYVLSPASRRDIVLGKNLAVAPFALLPAAVALVVVGVACPPRPDHLLAVLVVTPAMFAIVCLVGNVVSILFPMPTAAGATKPVRVKALPVLANLAVMGLLPVAFAPLLLPLGLELLAGHLTGLDFLPLALPLSVGLLAAFALLYRAVLPVEGRLLAGRERAVLAAVTSVAE